MSSRRTAAQVSASEITDIASEWEAQDEEMEEETGTTRRRNRAYRDMLMLSEWMVEVPEELEDKWLMLVVPVGKRCAVVSSQGQTRCFARNGFQFMSKFPSLLPGGNGNSRGTSRQNAILDCVFSDKEKTFFILDVILWNGASFYGCQTDLRFFWLDSKREDLAPTEHTSHFNKFPFKRLTPFPCSKDQVREALSHVTYASGVSCL